ncbi:MULTISPECIES: aminotransferase class I/II-fold pyridoxal phosphate-dependent enzyme [unclassified Dietzia]|uniref:aminotransferase class I/II-fold pyridoxal phosphate-dependent enzyme n=1 Tax=unclassified Dietzia TaxID=2617939 RepID=UPI0015C9B264|nr:MULTISPECIES: aminotransferase class I/II-fold pyridoxal phosphate-dependent enzyme [unclassified Dietzia]MBB1042338.1 aminotransferase class I/II-fold pyridoxal phosphate-dependent enzyme [Dietzia sp. Cai40]MBB1044930.1 aminotransferase class I/II-fold pyridoxal phosphate-dependent enzyme [Dietzia sp. DQ11-44]
MALSDLSADELTRLESELSSEYDTLADRGLSLDLTRGKPSPEQLDLSERLLALPGEGDHTAGRTDVRNYGGGAGLPELRGIIAELLGVDAGRVIAQDNASLSIMYDLLTFSMLFGTPDSERPWKDEPELRWLCPVPGYDRHFGITEALGIEMIPVTMGQDGPDMDEVEHLVATDPSIKGMWCVPIYSNPTGTVYSDHTVSRLARMAAAAPDFRVIWDNAYVVHTLTEDFPKVPDVDSLAAEAGHPNRFLQVCSTSKITFAGAGVSFLSASEPNLDWYLGHTGIRSIGPNKVNQLAHARFFGDADGVRDHMQKHRGIVAPKFEAAAGALDRRLGGYDVARWTSPEGGYFIDLEVPDGTATETVRLAKAVGVALTPAGSAYPYGQDPDDRHIRLAPTLPPLAEVETAMDVVGLCALLAACRDARN